MRNYPTITASLPTCPFCGSANHRVNKTVDEGVEKTQYAICMVCKEKFKILWEFPQGGILDLVNPYNSGVGNIPSTNKEIQ